LLILITEQVPRVLLLLLIFGQVEMGKEDAAWDGVMVAVKAWRQAEEVRSTKAGRSVQLTR